MTDKWTDRISTFRLKGGQVKTTYFGDSKNIRISKKSKYFHEISKKKHEILKKILNYQKKNIKYQRKSKYFMNLKKKS